jgi:hypothetical protein
MSRFDQAREAFFDIHPVTGASIEVFFRSIAAELRMARRKLYWCARGSGGPPPQDRRSGLFRRAVQPIATRCVLPEVVA